MKQWVDTPAALAEESDRDAHALALARYELAIGRRGGALAALRKRIAAQPATAGGDEAKELTGARRALPHVRVGALGGEPGGGAPRPSSRRR